jgi:hypothetical protein
MPGKRPVFFVENLCSKRMSEHIVRLVPQHFGTVHLLCTLSTIKSELGSDPRRLACQLLLLLKIGVTRSRETLCDATFHRRCMVMSNCVLFASVLNHAHVRCDLGCKLT